MRGDKINQTRPKMQLFYGFRIIKIWAEKFPFCPVIELHWVHSHIMLADSAGVAQSAMPSRPSELTRSPLCSAQIQYTWEQVYIAAAAAVSCAYSSPQTHLACPVPCKSPRQSSGIKARRSRRRRSGAGDEEFASSALARFSRSFKSWIT